MSTPAKPGKPPRVPSNSKAHRLAVAVRSVAGSVVVAGLLSGCSALAPTAPPATPAHAEHPEATWHAVSLPGKQATKYVTAHKEGRRAVHAVADRSASMWRRRLGLHAHEVREVRLSWWVDQLNPQADVRDLEREDAVVRVAFAFEGDRERLSPRNRMLFDLAQTLTGEAPPYATLMYVWDPQAEEGSVVVNGRTDRVRKIVLDSGPQGLRRWREHRRDLVADFRRAFGEEPGRLVAVALMTDTDNTQARAEAWYGPVEVLAHPAP